MKTKSWQHNFNVVDARLFTLPCGLGEHGRDGNREVCFEVDGLNSRNRADIITNFADEEDPSGLSNVNFLQ